MKAMCEVIMGNGKKSKKEVEMGKKKESPKWSDDAISDLKI